MADGWETRRRRGPGYDWVVVRLGRAGRIERVVVDTSHFKGNAPGSCSLESCHAPDASEVPDRGWTELLAQTELQPDTMHEFATTSPPATHVRLNIHPDGGVARLRVFGRTES